MTTERERPLQELYDLTPQIPEPEITPVLEGTCRIRGPMDETDNHLTVNLVDSKERSPKHFIDENFCTRTVPGTCNVCSAPCSSCMHHSKAESVMESKVEDAFQEKNLRKEADNFSTINSQVTASYKSRVCDDGEHVASEGSNFFGETSSPDSFSENADSKTAARIPDTRDVSKNVNLPTKVLPDKSIFEDELQPRTSNAENINTQSVLSKKTPDSLPQKTSFQDVKKYTLGSQGDNISCVSRTSGVNIAGHPDMILGRKDMPCNSIFKDPKDLKIQTAYGANAEFETNSRHLNDHVNESLKYLHFSSENGVSPGNPASSHFSSQIKEPSSSDTNPKEGENPCIQTPAPGGPSETSSKHESSRLAGADDTSPIIGSSDASLEFGERKHSPPVNELSPYNANVNHKNVKDSISADGGNSSNRLIESDIMKQENQNTVTESKLCEPSQAKSESSSGTLMGNQKSVRSGSDMDRENSPDQQRQTDTPKEENGNPYIEPDFLEDDVKVCDICGDAGREDLLAICSKCSDGAEHTYCMRIMLDKVPEGDWLCEECKLKEDAESKRVVKPEEVRGMSREPSFNKSHQDFGNTDNNDSRNQTKVDNKTTAATQPVKGLKYLRATSKIHVDNMNITMPCNKKTSEIKSPIAMSPGMGSPHTLKKLSRESSSKSLDAVKVRRNEVSLLSANSSQVQNHAPTSSEHNSSNIQGRCHSARGSLSKSSFDNMKAKVKPIIEHIPQKVKSFNEPTRNDMKKGVNHMMCKSASFKGMGRTRSCIDSTCKPQHISQTDDTRSLTQGKERSNMDRRNSFKTDRLHSSSSLLSVSSISSKRDIKAASNDGKLIDPSETSISFANKGPEDKNCSVIFDEKKQQASYSEKICPPKEEFTSENQKPIRGSPSANTVTDKSCDSVVQSGLPQSLPSAGRDVKNKPVSLSNSRQASPSGDKRSKCQTCKETGHATQFCSFDKIRVTALKPSGERNQVGKINKWKDAANKAVLKAKLYTDDRLSDQPNRLPLSSTSITKKASTKDQLDISGHCKNLTPSEETTDVEESSRSFTNNSNKTTFQNDVQQKAPLPVEPAHASKIGDSIVHSDASKSKPLEILPENTSMCTPLSRALAFPETCHIWQGSFEVYRSGIFYILYDGVQAHLCNCASPKVLEVATSFPTKVQLDESTCVNSWPSQFRQRPPTEENIALFFFATDFDSYEKHYKKLVGDMMKNDLVLKGSVKGAELLIFPSNKLPERARCWNGFNYLWGVLRAKKSDFPEQIPDREKKPCLFSYDAERMDQDFPPCSADISVLEKENSCRPVIEESFTSHMQAKIGEDQKPTASMNAEIMTCESKNWSFDLNENSQDDKSLEELAFDNSFPSKKQHTCTSRESTSVSMTRETSVLSSCCNLIEVGAIQHPRKEKNEPANVEKSAGCSSRNTTFLPDILTGKGKGMDTLPAPAAVPLTELSVKRTVAEEKTNTTERVIDLEAAPECLQPESIVHEEHATSGPMHNVKRTRSYSPESVSKASDKVLSRELMLSGLNQESKKLKHCHGEDFADDGLAEHLGSERCFFPISSGSPAEAMPAEVIPSSIISSGNGVSHIDVPNLELVLGSEQEERSQKILPLFFSLPETRHARTPDTLLLRNDDPASLRLSLGVPSSENGPLSRRTAEVENASRMERHPTERRNLNSSFLLFGGVIDSGKE